MKHREVTPGTMNYFKFQYSVQNGEAKMLVLSTDSNKLAEAKRAGSLEDAVRALPDYVKMLLPQHLLNKVLPETE